MQCEKQDLLHTIMTETRSEKLAPSAIPHSTAPPPTCPGRGRRPEEISSAVGVGAGRTTEEALIAANSATDWCVAPGEPCHSVNGVRRPEINGVVHRVVLGPGAP